MKGKSQVPILIVIIFKRITLSYNLVGGIVILRQLGIAFGPLSKIKAKGSAQMTKCNNMRFSYTVLDPLIIGLYRVPKDASEGTPSNVQGE